MPLFHINNKELILIRPTNFNLEKDIQRLIENNLMTVFNCRFVASEFPTGSEHAGRIDTLALSEDDNPVIIEYKKVESSELINQSLYYLSWIKDHKGDFHIAAQKQLGGNIEIDWSDVRVLCIAPGYKKYDLHAVQMMGANIELWQYRLFDNGAFYLEEVFRRSKVLSQIESESNSDKDPIMVAAGKKAAITRATGSYTFEEHLENIDDNIRSLVYDTRDFILGIDDSIEENPKKFYIAYKITQNFVCLEVKRNKIILFLKLNPKNYDKLPDNARDVSEIGHYGTGDFELTIKNEDDFKIAQEHILEAFVAVGG